MTGDGVNDAPALRAADVSSAALAACAGLGGVLFLVMELEKPVMRKTSAEH